MYKFVDNESKSVRKEYLDARFWNPECSNAVIMDWAKWESFNPAPPEIYDPPQRKIMTAPLTIPLYWYHRSCYFQPIAMCLHKYFTNKPETELISEDTLFKKMLDPNTISEKTPAVFKYKLFWMEDNVMAETLISFNSWAWRSQNGESRIVGVGTFEEGFTSDPTCFGCIMTKIISDSVPNIQISPDGKWILIGQLKDPTSKGKVNYIFIYVVQEGDLFKTPDGKIIEYVKPGNLLRLTWDSNDPYECDNNKLTYMYFLREVASLNEAGNVEKIQPHYNDLRRKALSTTKCCPTCCSTCCFACSCLMSAEDRFDYQVASVSDKQHFASASKPPLPEIIERL